MTDDIPLIAAVGPPTSPARKRPPRRTPFPDRRGPGALARGRRRARRGARRGDRARGRGGRRAGLPAGADAEPLLRRRPGRAGGGRRRAGGAARRPDVRVRSATRRASTACTCTRRCTSAQTATTGSGYNTAIVVAPDGRLVARTRKLHIPVTAGYHEDRYFRPGPGGDAPFPVLALGRGAPRAADVLGPVVPGGRARVQPRGRRRARVPDGDRLGARAPGVRHAAAVGARDRRQRDRQRRVHGRRQPDRRGAGAGRRRAADVLRLVVHLRPVRAQARAGAARSGRRCSSPTSTSTSATTGSSCSRS